MSPELLLTLGSIFFFSMSQNMLMILVPLLATSINLSPAVLGLTFVIPALVTFSTTIPLAILSNNIGRRILIIIGAWITLFSAFFFLFTKDAVLLSTAITLVSLAGSFFWGQALALVTEQSTPGQHARDQGYNGLLQGASALFSVLMVGFLVDLVGFSGSYLVAACLAFLALLFSVKVRERFHPGDNRFSFSEVVVSYGDAFSLLRNAKIQLSTLFSTIGIILNHAIGNTFFPVYAILVNGSTSVLIGTYIGSRNLLGMLVSLTFGFFAKKMGKYWPLIFGLGLATVVIPFIPLVKNPVFLVALFSLQGIGMGFLPAGPNLLVAEGTSFENRTMGFALQSLLSRVSALAIPALLGLVVKVVGLGYVFIVGSVMSVFLLVVSLRIYYRKNGSNLIGN